MIYEICVIVAISATRKGNKIPMWWAIAIAPTKKIAKNFATRELFPFLKLESHDDKEVDKWKINLQQVGQIFFPSVPTIVFLYTKDAGRIK